MRTTFLLNGETVTVDSDATVTLLDYLRIEKRLTGTKEGCNEGDCGACTVMVQDRRATRALNACILFLPQLDGKAVTTVEGLTGPDGVPHPAQTALVTHHGAQCGFCTPGFAVSMATAHLNGATDHDDQLAGNLCRCTGYAPIIRAAQAIEADPVPPHLSCQMDRIPAQGPNDGDALVCRPTNADDLATWYAAHPEATLIAGATDVGLWVTKHLMDLAPVAFLTGCDDLKTIAITDTEIRIGAMATLTDVRAAITPHHPDLADMLRRYGSTQVRNAATLGGNIANGSPIGDAPPALIALGATLHLRQGDARRALPLEDFFRAYRDQDRAPGEFVEAVSIPRQPDHLKCYKLSKRFDQDISSVCGCFNITVTDGTVTAARIAFGGMAGTPHRATAVETTLTGAPWTQATIAAAMDQFPNDFKPMSDLRASADYRMISAQNMLQRYFLEATGAVTRVRELRP